MVTCSRCGNKNREDAQFCVDCGSPLYPTRRVHHRDACFGAFKRHEDDCFGLPFGWSIIGIVFGAYTILLGLSMIFQVELLVAIPALGLLLIGALLISTVIYNAGRSGR